MINDYWQITGDIQVFQMLIQQSVLSLIARGCPDQAASTTNLKTF